MSELGGVGPIDSMEGPSTASVDVGGKYRFEGGFSEGGFVGEIQDAAGNAFQGMIEDLGGGKYKVTHFDEQGLVEEFGGEGGVAAVEASGAVEVPAALEPAIATAEEMLAAAAETAIPLVEPAPALAEALPLPAGLETGPQTPGSLDDFSRAMDNQFSEVDARLRGETYNAQVKSKADKEIADLEARANEIASRRNRLRKNESRVNSRADEARLRQRAVDLKRQFASITPLDESQLRSIQERRDTIVFIQAEVKKWRTILADSSSLHEYQRLPGQMQEELSQVDRLFGGDSPEDQAVRRVARDRVESRTKARMTQISAGLPQRLLQLAGLAQKWEVDDYTPDHDLWVGHAESNTPGYFPLADQLYAELMGGTRLVSPEPLPVSALEPPVVEPSPPVEPLPVPAPMTELPADLTPPPMPAEEPLPPIEVTEQAPEVLPAPPPGDLFPFPDQTPSAPVEASLPLVEPPPPPVEPPAAVGAESIPPPPVATVEFPEHPPSWIVPEGVEQPAAPEPAAEAVPEDPRAKAERRVADYRNSWVALRGAFADQSGTAVDQEQRVVRATAAMLAAGSELEQEGEMGKQLVKESLAGPLGSPEGRTIIQAAVKELFTQSGVFDAEGNPKKKEELEQMRKEGRLGGILGILEVLLELGMSFTDTAIGTVVEGVKETTGAAR